MIEYSFMGNEGLRTSPDLAKQLSTLNPKQLVSEKATALKKTLRETLTLRVQESILTEIPIDQPPYFDEMVAEYFPPSDKGDEAPRYFPVVMGTHKSHVAGLPTLKVAERVRNIAQESSGHEEIQGSLLLVASNIDGGQNDTITQNFRTVQPLLAKLRTKTQGILRKKDRDSMSRSDMLPILREQKRAIRSAIANGLIPVTLPEGTVKSGRFKDDGSGEIYGMMQLEPGSITYLTNLIEELGMDPLLFFVGNTGENKIYDPNTEMVTDEADKTGKKRAVPGGKLFTPSIMSSIVDYPTPLSAIREALGVDGKLAPGILEQYCGERLNQLLPYSERGDVYDNPTLLDSAPTILRRTEIDSALQKNGVIFQKKSKE